MHKLQMHTGAISMVGMVCESVWAVLDLLKLVEYPPVQMHKMFYLMQKSKSSHRGHILCFKVLLFQENFFFKERPRWE